MEKNHNVKGLNEKPSITSQAELKDQKSISKIFIY